MEGLSVARVILMVFGLFILLGSLGIFLAEKGMLSFTDSFFLSASAVCVTGLSPVELSELTHASHWIIMILIQLGGLGIISFTVIIGLLIVRGESRNIRFNFIVKEAIDATNESEVAEKYKSSEVRRILFSVVNISMTIEAIGAISIYYFFPADLPPNVNRLFFSVFTSISSFNNAGFSIINDLSIIAFHPLSIYIVSLLIILGGIGFPVIIYVEKIGLQALQKIFYHIESRLETYFYSKIITNPSMDKFPILYETFIKFSHYLDEKIEDYNSHLHGESNRIQYKILFYGTLILLTIGTFTLLALEINNPHTLFGMDWDVKLANAFFISVCSRTAGFSTIDLSGANDASIVIIAVLMFIGGGPQGTAGGVKITTFAILAAYLKNVINPSKTVQLFGETISKNSVAISIRVYFLATTVLALIFIVLAIMNQNENNLHIIFFELISAFSTVGYSLGLTPNLGDIEKIFFAIIMLVGRIGVFTVLIAITGHSGVPRMGEDDGVKIQVG
ncbi:MAG: potassium transporter Trk [Leptospira sp.]|nr:potassium transporter Trk [Leptospira sp.]